MSGILQVRRKPGPYRASITLQVACVHGDVRGVVTDGSDRRAIADATDILVARHRDTVRCACAASLRPAAARSRA